MYGFIIGFILGASIVYFVYKHKNNELVKEIDNIRARSAGKMMSTLERLEQLEKDNRTLIKQLRNNETGN